MHRRPGSRVEDVTRKVDVRLPGKENPNYHSARPVHLIITNSDQQGVDKELSLWVKYMIINNTLP